MIPERMPLKSQRACYVFAALYDFSEDTRANVSEEGFVTKKKENEEEEVVPEKRLTYMGQGGGCLVN